MRRASAGRLSLRLGLPGAGKVKVVELAPHHVTFGKDTVSVAAKRTLGVKITPTAAGEALLSKALLAKHAPPKVTLEVTYTPKGGVAKTVTKRGIKVLAK